MTEDDWPSSVDEPQTMRMEPSARPVLSVVLGVLLLLGCLGVVAAWGQLSAIFPAGLYTYESPLPAKRIGPADFEQLAREVEALEAALGPNLANIVTAGEKCFYIEQPATRRFPTLWRAPSGLRVNEVYCEIEDGTSVAVDVEIDDGDPTGIVGSPLTCTTTPQTLTTLGGDTQAARGDRFDVVVGTVTGSVTSFSICIRWEPTA